MSFQLLIEGDRLKIKKNYPLNKMNLYPKGSQHPIQKVFNSKQGENAFILLSDDNEDLPLAHQTSLNKRHYFCWYTVALPIWAFKLLYQDWSELKNRYNIPNNFLHCKIRSHKRIIEKKNAQFITEAINLLLSYNSLTCYYTSNTKDDLSHFHPKNQKGWLYKAFGHVIRLACPKSLSMLFHHLSLDTVLKDDFYLPLAYSFCDKTSSSEKMAIITKDDERAGWHSIKNIPLKHIFHDISFRLKEIPTDEIGKSLDIPDFIAWCFRKTTQNLILRDFGYDGPNLTKMELESRLAQLDETNKTICENFLRFSEAGKFKPAKFTQTN